MVLCTRHVVELRNCFLGISWWSVSVPRPVRVYHEISGWASLRDPGPVRNLRQSQPEPALSAGPKVPEDSQFFSSFLCDMPIAFRALLVSCRLQGSWKPRDSTLQVVCGAFFNAVSVLTSSVLSQLSPLNEKSRSEGNTWQTLRHWNTEIKPNNWFSSPISRVQHLARHQQNSFSILKSENLVPWTSLAHGVGPNLVREPSPPWLAWQGHVIRILCAREHEGSHSSCRCWPSTTRHLPAFACFLFTFSRSDARKTMFRCTVPPTRHLCTSEPHTRVASQWQQHLKPAEKLCMKISNEKLPLRFFSMSSFYQFFLHGTKETWQRCGVMYTPTLFQKNYDIQQLLKDVSCISEQTRRSMVESSALACGVVVCGVVWCGVLLLLWWWWWCVCVCMCVCERLQTENTTDWRDHHVSRFIKITSPGKGTQCLSPWTSRCSHFFLESRRIVALSGFPSLCELWTEPVLDTNSLGSRSSRVFQQFLEWNNGQGSVNVWFCAISTSFCLDKGPFLLVFSSLEQKAGFLPAFPFYLFR